MQGAGRKPEKGVAYLIVKGERTEGIELGELDITVENYQTSWRFTSKKIMGSPYELSQVLGMGVLFPSGKYIASSWVDAPGEIFARGNFPVWSPKKPKERPQLRAASVAAAEAGGRDAAAPQGEWKVHQGRLYGIDGKPARNSVQPKAEASDTVQSPKPQNPDSMQRLRSGTPGNITQRRESGNQHNVQNSGTENQDSKQRQGTENQDNIMQRQRTENQDNIMQDPESVNHDSAQPVQPEPSATAGQLRRIDISDIRTLPKANWHLCNNSFLIHGFFNYHYLILWEREENGAKKKYLGVPGIYERPERAMALLFGFPEFVAEETVRGEEQGQAENTGGSFGYWICQLNL